MPEKSLFEYATIRIVPKVEREEFLNVGVILYCRDQNFLKCLYALNKTKLEAVCGDTDCREVEDHMISFDKICRGDREGGPIAALDIASRFRWLTATRSTIVQTSRVHPGLCRDPDETLLDLHRKLVL